MKVLKTKDGKYRVEKHRDEKSKELSPEEIKRMAKKEPDEFDDLLSIKQDLVRKAAKRGDKDLVEERIKDVQRVAKIRARLKRNKDK